MEKVGGRTKSAEGRVAKSVASNHLPLGRDKHSQASSEAEVGDKDSLGLDATEAHHGQRQGEEGGSKTPHS